jgi:hypothetical protein
MRSPVTTGLLQRKDIVLDASRRDHTVRMDDEDVHDVQSEISIEVRQWDTSGAQHDGHSWALSDHPIAPSLR